MNHLHLDKIQIDIIDKYKKYSLNIFIYSHVPAAVPARAAAFRAEMQISCYSRARVWISRVDIQSRYLEQISMQIMQRCGECQSEFECFVTAKMDPKSGITLGHQTSRKLRSGLWQKKNSTKTIPFDVEFLPLFCLFSSKWLKREKGKCVCMKRHNFMPEDAVLET